MYFDIKIFYLVDIKPVVLSKEEIHELVFLLQNPTVQNCMFSYMIMKGRNVI